MKNDPDEKPSKTHNNLNHIILSYLRDLIYYSSGNTDLEFKKDVLRKQNCQTSESNLKILNEFLDLTGAHKEHLSHQFPNQVEDIFNEMSYNFCLAC